MSLEKKYFIFFEIFFIPSIPYAFFLRLAISFAFILSILENNIIFAKTIKITYPADYMVAKFEGNTHRKFKSLDDVEVDVEKYFYGKITNAGGKNDAHICLDTQEGNLIIEANKEYIGDFESNLLYKDFLVRVKAKQNLYTGEIDKKTLKLLEIREYTPTYNEEYINRKIEESTPIWKGVDADEYVRSIRDGTF